MGKKYAESGVNYTFAQILELTLRDGPHLSFKLDVNGKKVEACLQDSHVTDEQLLAVPGFAESVWTYRYETSEWIPIFAYASTNVKPITDLIDYEPWIDPYETRLNFWCTPKGLPRRQYYAQLPDGQIVRTSDGRPHNEY